MKLSRSSAYAVHAVVYMAQQQDSHELITSHAIAVPSALTPAMSAGSMFGSHGSMYGGKKNRAPAPPI